MGRHRWVLPLACVAVLSLAAPAGAQEDDVFVDPESPTGHEYDIPLERARREASRDQSEPQSYRSRTAPLFGQGIEPPAESNAAPTARSSGGSGNRDAEREQRSRKPASADRKRLPRAVEAAIQQPGAPSDSTAQLAALAGALLVGLGVVGGLVLRRSRR